MKLHVAMTALLFASPALLSGCSDSKAAYESADKYAYEHRETFRTDMNMALDKLEVRLEQLQAKAASGGAAAKAETATLIEETRAGLLRMRGEMAKVGATTKERWSEFQHGCSNTADEMGRKLDAAFN